MRLDTEVWSEDGEKKKNVVRWRGLQRLLGSTTKIETALFF